MPIFIGIVRVHACISRAFIIQYLGTQIGDSQNPIMDMSARSCSVHVWGTIPASLMVKTLDSPAFVPGFAFHFRPHEGLFTASCPKQGKNTCTWVLNDKSDVEIAWGFFHHYKVWFGRFDQCRANPSGKSVWPLHDFNSCTDQSRVHQIYKTKPSVRRVVAGLFSGNSWSGS